MEYIPKLPFMLGAFMAIVIGAISYVYQVGQQEIYIRMIVCLIVFYIIGIFIKNTVIGITDEIKSKKDAEEKEKLAELERQRKEESEVKVEYNGTISSKLDLKVDESFDEGPMFGEDFSPLTVKEFLRSSNKEQS